MKDSNAMVFWKQLLQSTNLSRIGISIRSSNRHKTEREETAKARTALNRICEDTQSFIGRKQISEFS